MVGGSSAGEPTKGCVYLQNHKLYAGQQSRCGEDNGTHGLSPSTPSEGIVGLCILGPCGNHIGSRT